MVTHTQKAVFRQGTKETNEVCQAAITVFATMGDRAEQFEVVREIITKLIWQALIHNFRYPMLEGIKSTSRYSDRKGSKPRINFMDNQ
jgi:hypothetical protein